MSKSYRARQSPLKRNTAFAREQFFRAVILLSMLTVNVMPVEAVQAGKMYSVPVMQGTTSLSFIAEADAYVHQSNPDTNYGNATSLLVNGANNPDVESFVRFTVGGATGSDPKRASCVYMSPPTPRQIARPCMAPVTTGQRQELPGGIARHVQVTSWITRASTRTNTWVEYNVSPL